MARFTIGSLLRSLYQEPIQDYAESVISKWGVNLFNYLCVLIVKLLLTINEKYYTCVYDKSNIYFDNLHIYKINNCFIHFVRLFFILFISFVLIKKFHLYYNMYTFLI